MKRLNSKAAVWGWAFVSLTLASCASVSSTLDLSNAPAKKTETPALVATVDPPGDLDSAIRQAQLKRTNGDLAGSAHDLSQLVLGAPDDPRVLGEYGKTLAAEGRADEALAFLERAVELQPNDWMLYSAQGVAYDQKGQYALAQNAYKRALGLKPGEPSVLSNEALSYMLTGDLQNAEALLHQATQNGGSDPKITHNLALVEELKISSPDSGKNLAANPTPIKSAAVTPAPVATPATSTPAAAKPATVIANTQPLPVPLTPVVVSASSPASTTKPKLTGIEALRADPTVELGPIPSSDTPAPRKATGKPKNLDEAHDAPKHTVTPVANETSKSSSKTSTTSKLATTDNTTELRPAFASTE